MADDGIPEEAIYHLEQLADMEVRFTHKRKREVLSALGYYDE